MICGAAKQQGICNLPHTFYRTIFSKNRISPDAIWRVRNNDKYVRINGNTARDGHQSLNGGQHRIEHLEIAAGFLGKIRKKDLEFPGVEEVGGGTTVDFPLRYKGENPFENMRRISKNMPNTPTMCLTRSDSIVGYSTNAKDVVGSFVRLYYEAGIDVFRNFDAYNNVDNHVNIAEAVLRIGGHYQGAISFTTHEDPTLYNVKWVAQMARNLKNLGAHSLCIKDMSGISTPAMMKAWVSEIKNAVPELPLVIHAHYTTGFAPITYLMAVEAGADAIDCAISSLSGRTGHPSMEVMARVLGDLGYDHGLDVDALAKCAEYYRSIHPLYKSFEADMAGSSDYRVFAKGIPGGQISIFKNELERNQLGHLFDPVMDSIQECRDDVGGVALVTPTADNVARQTVINARAKEDDRQPYMTFWSGYNEMLRGALGQPKQPMNEQLQKRALRQHCEFVLKQLVENGELNEDIAKLFDEYVISNLQDALWELSKPVRYRLRIKEIEERIEQLNSLSDSQHKDMDNEIAALKERRVTEIEQRIEHFKSLSDSQRKELVAKMDAGIAALKGAHNLSENVNETIKALKQEAITYKNDEKKLFKVSDSDYAALLKLNPSEYLKSKIWSHSPELEKLVDKLSKSVIAKLISAAAFITVPPSTALPESMPLFREEVEILAKKYRFKLPPENSDAFEEYAVLYAIFKTNQDIALNFFKNVNSNMEFWPPVPGKKHPEKHPKAEIQPKMFPFVTKNVDSISKIYSPEWSKSQIESVMKNELDALADNSKKREYLQLLVKKTQSKIRKEIITEDINDLVADAKKIREFVKGRFAKANRFIPAVGYDVDLEVSLSSAVTKFELLLTNGTQYGKWKSQDYLGKL